MSVPDEIDRKLAGKRLLFRVVVGGAMILAGGMIYTATRMNGPVNADILTVIGFAGSATAMLVRSYFLRSHTFEEPVATDPPTPAAGMFLVEIYVGEYVAPACLRAVGGILSAFGYFMTHHGVFLALLPVIVVALLRLTPTRPRFDAWLWRRRAVS